MVIKPNQMLSALKVEFLPKLPSLPYNQYYIKSLIKCNESVNLLVAHNALCSFEWCSLMTWNVKVKSSNSTTTCANPLLLRAKALMPSISIGRANIYKDLYLRHLRGRKFIYGLNKQYDSLKLNKSKIYILLMWRIIAGPRWRSYLSRLR